MIQIIATEQGSKIFRPTLYDFLAHRALEFFKNEEPALIKPAAGFALDKESYFAPAVEFAALIMATGGKDDLKWQAISLYQELIRFHLNDKDPAALIDVDLARIKFVQQESVLANRHDLYLQALQNLQNSFPGDQHSAVVSYEIALEYQRRGQEYNPPQSDTNRWAIKTAKEICDKTISSFPGSQGAQNCSILLRQITEPALTFSLKYANVPDQPFLGFLNYENIDEIFFRIIKINPEDDRNLRQKERGEMIISKYISAAPVKGMDTEIAPGGRLPGTSHANKDPGPPQGILCHPGFG